MNFVVAAQASFGVVGRLATAIADDRQQLPAFRACVAAPDPSTSVPDDAGDRPRELCHRNRANAAPMCERAPPVTSDPRIAHRDGIQPSDEYSMGLGPRETWTSTLRTLVDVVRGSMSPMALLWGPDWLLVPNDAYCALAHDARLPAVASPVREHWAEAWQVEPARLATLMERGERVLVSGRGVQLCHSPVLADDGSVAGALVTLQRGASPNERVLGRPASDSAPLLHAITNDSSDVIFAKDLDGRLIYANPATLALIGKPREAVLGKTDLELLDDPDVAREVMGNDRRVMVNGVATELEEVVPTPDGKPRTWLSRKAPYRDAAGRVIGLLGISRDITERKRAAQAERKAKEQLEATLGSITDGVLMLDRDWRYTYVSETAARMIRVDRGALLQRCVWDVFPDAVRSKFYPEYHRAVETRRPVHFEEFYPAPIDKWLECHCYPTSDGLSVYFRDITDRKEAETALRASDEQLRAAVASLTVERNKLEAIIRTLPVGIGLADTNGTTVSMNDAALKLHGFASIADMLQPLEAYRRGFELRALDGTPLPPADWPAARARRGDYAQDLEVQLCNLDVGTHRTVSYSVVAVRDAADDVTLLAYFMLDITERKRNEAALRQATHEIATRAQTIKAITDNASLGLVMLDPAQRCTFLNPAAEEIFGFDFAEIRELSRPLHDIIHHTRPDGSRFPIDECPIDRALPNRSRQHGEDTLVRRDGTFYPVAFTASPISDEHGVAVGTIVEVEDLTDRRARERELRDSTNRLELLARATSVFMDSKLDAQALLDRLVGELVPTHSQSAFVVLLSADNQLEVAAIRHSDRAAEIELTSIINETSLPARYSLTPDELRRGKSLRVEHAPESALRDGVDARLRAYLDAHPVGSLLAVPLRTAHGVFGALRASRPPEAAPFSAGDEALFQDIADRAALALEAALRFAEAQRAIALRDQFLSIASHELRTPLTALQLQLQSISHLLSKDEAAANPKFVRKIEVSNRQTLRLVALVDDLLDVSRLTTAKLALRREEFDLADAAREAVDRHTPHAHASGCVLTLRTESALGTWDRLRVEQVITNLVGNAIKYGRGASVDIQVSSTGETAVLSVADHGIGIAAADRDRIFGRFERAVSGEHYGGLGLGLYIAKQIVETHAGRIEVESEPGRGSTFRVILPKAVPPSPP